MHTFSHLETRLAASGLYLRGYLKVSEQEIETFGLDVESGALVVLVGNIGSSYWSSFILSPEYGDKQSHPLDRWSRRIGRELASEVSARVVYPFEGPPYYPFQQWARRAESLRSSKMGMLIHPEYGLWHSYRFGFLFPFLQDFPDEITVREPSPCESCIDQPCLNTCPVNAFREQAYDVDSCAEYLKNSPEAQCHSQGCIARSSCPVGKLYRYSTAEHRFHLKAFLASR